MRLFFPFTFWVPGGGGGGTYVRATPRTPSPLPPHDHHHHHDNKTVHVSTSSLSGQRACICLLRPHAQGPAVSPPSFPFQRVCSVGERPPNAPRSKQRGHHSVCPFVSCPLLPSHDAQPPRAPATRCSRTWPRPLGPVRGGATPGRRPHLPRRLFSPSPGKASTASWRGRGIQLALLHVILLLPLASFLSLRPPTRPPPPTGPLHSGLCVRGAGGAALVCGGVGVGGDVPI